MAPPTERIDARDLDLVIYGATGFTGRQAARYLAAHAPPGLRWALAGRDAAKLEEARRELDTTNAGPHRPRELLRADAGDPASLAAMVRRTRVIVSTAGPFAKFSDPVVTACVEARTDYTDITGETPWVRRLIDRHHARAAAEGTRIVPCCGFDSIPSDLGTFMVVDWVRRTWQSSTRRVTSSFVVGGGGINGGTVASALGMAEQGESPALDDPLHLVPPDLGAATVAAAGPGAGPGLEGRPVRRATRHPDLPTWLAPFVIAPINTHIVLRSAALHAARGAPYGKPLFRYEEAMEVKRPVTASLVAVGTRVGDRLLRSSVGRGLVRRLAPRPGEGPSEAAMARGFFRTRLVAEADDGRKALGQVSCQGDAGNRATVLMLCQSGLALALDRDRLPPGGGVLTASTAMGTVLLERLRRAGMTWTVEELRAPTPTA